MARPVNADAAATKRRILEEATALFAEQGEGKSSIREIARRSGISLAMVHHYFGSKEALYAACVDAMYEELAALRPALAESVCRADDPSRVVDEVMRTLFRFACSHRMAVRLMLRSVVDTGELDEERRERFLRPFLDEASALLSPLVGRPPRALRLPLQSLVFLTARYAIASDQELAIASGACERSAALAAVEDHLVEAARAVLGVSPRKRSTCR